MRIFKFVATGIKRLSGSFVRLVYPGSFCLIFLLFQACISNQIDAQTSQVEAQNSETEPKLELIVDGLKNPWGMAFLPDESMLITEKSGSLIHFKEGVKNNVSGLPKIVVLGQGGLLDVIIHPDFDENHLIYLSYSSPEGNEEGGNTAILRARFVENQLLDKEVIYKAEPNSNSPVHWGSRMVFDSNGLLYFSIGDRYKRDHNPQSIKRDGGKIYRLHDDGSIPTNNPFVGVTGAKEAVFSYGHRNPQGMAIHPETGQVWVHEHGPKGGDEINIIRKGKNYGWPQITYGMNYDGSTITNETHATNMEQPLFYWTPSIAPCGMAFVSSDKYAKWKGSLLVGSLKFRYLERLTITDQKVTSREKLFEGVGRLRNAKEAPNGDLYISVEGKGIYRIIPR